MFPPPSLPASETRLCIGQSEVVAAGMSSSQSLICGHSKTRDSSVYCRKQKSLGLLCSNFLKLYDKDGVEVIQLDNAASLLDVERRRIYDIVNILESVGVLARKAKSQYTWKGLQAIPRALEILKEGGLPKKFNASNQGNELSDDNNHNQLLNSKTYERKEKSMVLLAQNFVKLFVCSDVKLISIDQVQSTLLDDICDPTSTKTVIRRLYDIANVFVSINLIDKVRHPDSGKSAFKWIGGQEHCKLGSSIVPIVQESKIRVFGSDITYTTSSKKRMVDCSSATQLTEKENVNCAHNQNIDCQSGNSLEKSQKRARKEFVFGPFEPPTVL